MALNQHDALDLITRVVFFSSLAHSMLPPWDFLEDFPRAKKYYKAFIYLVGYVAINSRSSVYRQSIGTNNGTQISNVSRWGNGDRERREK